MGARARDLEKLYRRDYLRFVRVATAVTGSAETARDAVQEGFASALRHRAAYRGEGPLAGWVWRTVVNEARRLRARAIGDAPPGDPPAPNGGPAGDDLGVRSWIAALPERQRLAVFLRYYADLDYRAIAAALEIETGTVSATLSAAHAALRKQLREVHE